MGNGGKIPRVEPGRPILTRSINGIVNAVNRLRMMEVTPPLSLFDGPAGPVIQKDVEAGFWARMTGNSGNAYSYQEVVWQGGTTVDVTGGRTGTTATRPAYEVNGITSLAVGWVDYLRPGAPGEYVFQSVKYGSGCTGTVTINVKCNGTNVSGATVTISQGGTTYATGTTDASGNFSTSALPASGTYDLTISKTGFATYTGTFVYSCANITVNVVLSSTTNVVSGRVTGCSSNQVGATVTVTQGVSTLGTGTTDASGNYSITLSGWSSGAVTVTASKTRFANGSTSTTPSSCGVTTTAPTIVLSPATDYFCDPCGGAVPVYKTLFLTQPWDGAVVTLSHGLGGWSGTGTWTGTGYTNCGSATTSTITITVNWTLSNSCFVTLQWNGCAAPNTSRNPISDAFAAANPSQVTPSFASDSSPTHTNSPFSVSASLTGYMGGGSGTATITE